jgi:DNA polymerase sigma
VYIISQLACDLNVNNTLAIQNTKMIKTYVSIDPRVRPLALLIKHWTKQRGINDAGNVFISITIYIFIYSI